MRIGSKFSLSVTILVFVVLLASVGIASAYTPRTGVLSPDEVDFGGKTVTILNQDVKWVVHNEGKPTDERIAEAEALFNVKIALGDMGTVDNMIARIMANDSTYDVIRFNHRSGYFPLVSGGYLLPVSTILPEEYFEELPAPDQHSISKLAFKGDLYGFGVTYGLFNGSMMITMYNKDLIEEAGLEDPYDLWLRGEWTYDAMEKIGIELTKDTDGDGVIDQWGIGDLNQASAVYRFIPSNGAEIAKQDENGKWVYTLNQPEAVNSLNTVSRWRNELNIMGNGDFNLNKVGVVPHTHLAGARHAVNAGVNLGYVPQPMGPDVESNQWPTFDFSANFLPSNVEYPEGMIALVEFLFREEDGEEYLDFYINSYMKSREDADVYMAGADEWLGEGDVFQGSGLWDSTNAAVNSVINGERGAKAALDEVAQQAQAFLDDLFGQ